MNYEEMSNHKINRKVLWLTQGENSVVYKDPKSPSGVLCHGSQGIFDPCNNWADAGQIIFDNGICLTSPYAGGKHQLWSASWNEDGGRWSCGDINQADKTHSELQ